MTESHSEQIARVEMMAEGTHDTWDLSDLDVLALKAVLEDRRMLLEACKEQMGRLTDLFNRHERQTYHVSSDPDTDLSLILSSGRIAVSKAEGVTA